MVRKIPFFSFSTHKRNHARSTKKTTKIARKRSVSSAQGSKNNLIYKYKLINIQRLELLQDKVDCQTSIVRVSKIKWTRWEGGPKETVWVLVKKCRSVVSDLNLIFQNWISVPILYFWLYIIWTIYSIYYIVLLIYVGSPDSGPMGHDSRSVPTLFVSLGNGTNIRGHNKVVPRAEDKNLRAVAGLLLISYKL